jgi:WD40 repeat protein
MPDNGTPRTGEFDMIIRCTCGKTIPVADDAAGRTIRCRACGEAFVVPTNRTAIESGDDKQSKFPNGESPFAEFARPRGTGNQLPDRDDDCSESRRPSRALLVASGGMGTLAAIGFVVSGVLWYLGQKTQAEPAAKTDNSEKKAVRLQAPAPQATQPKLAESPPTENRDAFRELVSIKEVYLMRLSLSSDGRRAVGATGTGINVWNLETGQLPATVGDDKRQIISSCLLSGDREVLVGRSEGSLEAIDLETKKVSRVFADNIKTPMHVAASADGRYAFSGGNPDRLLHRWDLQSGREVNGTEPLAGSVHRLCIAATGERALLETGRGAQIWDAHKGPAVRSLSLPRQQIIINFALSADGRQALIAFKSQVVLWDVDADQSLHTFELPRQPLVVSIAPDGRTALVGSLGSTEKSGPPEDAKSFIWMLDLEKRQRIHEVRTDVGGVTTLVHTADGKRAASHGVVDRTLRFWQLPSH